MLLYLTSVVKRLPQQLSGHAGFLLKIAAVALSFEAARQHNGDPYYVAVALHMTHELMDEWRRER